jgi:hypothetical protein
MGYQQFAVVAAVLCGFAIAWFGALLALPHGSRAVTWGAAAAGVSSCCLVVATLAASFVAIDASTEGQLPHRAVLLKPVMALGFVLGVSCLLLSVGCGGWQRSRRLGIVVASASALAFVASMWIVSLYL